MPDYLDFIPLYVRTEDDIRADMDMDANAGLAPDNPAWVDTREISFFHMVTQPCVMECARVHDRIATIPAVAFIPFAFGPYLDYHAQSLNTERIAAVAATGVAHFTGPAGTPVAAGTRISTEPPDSNTQPIIFETTESVTINGPLATPSGLAGSLATTGGSLTGPQDRYYVITAQDAAGETLASNEVHINIASGVTAGEVTLTWPLDPDAVSYWVYEGSATGAENQAIAVTSPGFTDPGGLTTWAVRSLPVANGTGGAIDVAIQAELAGVDGNVAATALTQMITQNTGVATVTNPAACANGKDVEDDPSLQTRLLELQEGTGPGTSSDYMLWVSELPNVGQVYVLPNWNGAGTVGIVVMDGAGHGLSTTEIAAIQTDLDPYPGQGGGIAPIDHIVTVMAPDEVAVNIAAALTFKAGFSYDGTNNTTPIRQNILNKLTQFFTSLTVGQDVYLDQLAGLFYQVEGVATVTITVPSGDVTITIPAAPAQPQRAILGTVTLT